MNGSGGNGLLLLKPEEQAQKDYDGDFLRWVLVRTALGGFMGRLVGELTPGMPIMLEEPINYGVKIDMGAGRIEAPAFPFELMMNAEQAGKTKIMIDTRDRIVCRFSDMHATDRQAYVELIVNARQMAIRARQAMRAASAGIVAPSVTRQ